jgi:hypothetical protein
MGNRTATIQELYYRRAIMNKEEKRIDYTFAIPLNREFSTYTYCQYIHT